MADLDIDIRDALQEAGVRRTRTRKSRFNLAGKRQEIADRVIKFCEHDIGDRDIFLDAKMQRYAKYRMWTERQDLPWEDASDLAIPDMMTDSLRLQDTLHNAVMAIQPPIVSKALNREDKEKQDTVDNILHHQMFVDMDGEEFVGELAEAFVNDGFYIIYDPWIVEDAKIIDVRVHSPIPPAQMPKQYFRTLIDVEYPNQSPNATQLDADGWDWSLPQENGPSISLRFYTRSDDKVEMVIEKIERVFDGPKPSVVEVDDVLFPWRSANLQPPGPSNPNGAPHVILRDYPTIDELKRLQKTGYYDLVTKKMIDQLETESPQKTDQEAKIQKDDFQGTTDNPVNDQEAKSHKRLTRLICFDRYDIDGDGLDEDVIFWVLKEKKLTLRVRILSEMFPSIPPMRPLITESMIPVKDRVIGIGLLEMMEGLHDAIKEIADQTVDGGTLANTPFFFYKPTSSLNPELIRLGPGDGMPLGNPKDDINFPNLSQQGQAFGFNMITILGQMSERLTMTSDLQRGQIPAGKSSALRTMGGIQAVLAQGEARPERILRRFFKGMSKLYRFNHEMNQRLLPDEKKILIAKTLDPDADPYQTVSDKSKIQGKFQFNFTANILNTSKAALQEALGQIMSVGISEIALQLGLTDQDGIYRMIRDFTKAWGQDPNDYFRKPSPSANLQPITAEEALVTLINGAMPGGMPVGGWMQHLTDLETWMNDPQFASFPESSISLLQQYLEMATAKAMEEQKQQQAIQAARNTQIRQQQQSNQGGAPDLSNQQLSNNEQLNEGLQ